MQAVTKDLKGKDPPDPIFPSKQSNTLQKVKCSLNE